MFATSRVFPALVLVLLSGACASSPPPIGAPSTPAGTPCFNIHAESSELRAKDAAKTIDDLAQHIRLAPEDEALRNPKSIQEVRTLLRRDAVYLFANAATFARTLNTIDGRFSEAQLELFLGESQLVASQILSTQEAWVGADLRMARANLASSNATSVAGGASGNDTDRGRMLAQLIRVVEEGNKIADALGIVAPTHITRGAELVRQLQKEAPNDGRTFMLLAEYHRLRGEWAEFDAAMKAADAAAAASERERSGPQLKYLRAMEQLERFRRPDLGANMMRETLTQFPKFMRAQVALVLMSTNPADGLRELEKLKQMNQDHYLVSLLEPTLAADQELVRMQSQAKPPAGAAASPPPTPTPAPAPKPKPKATTTAPQARDALMDQILGGGGNAALKSVLATPDKYRFQVLYGVIKEGAKPTLERHAFRADAEYFFPASSMKMPIALATYERLAAIRASAQAPDLNREATIRIHAVSPNDDPWTTTLARETWRALIVSDNFAANRLLGFVGHREAHEALWALGLPSVRIRSGFATGDTIDPAEQSPRVELVAAGGGAASKEILAARKSNLALPPTDAAGLAIGEANIVDGRRVDGPLSFADKNAIRLRDLQDTLVRIMRPELLGPKAARDTASPEDLDYLKQALGTLPSESGLAGFDRNVVADYTLVPFLRGIERVRARGRFQIHSKVGQAFGFLIANAYIVDKESGRAFFLVAAVYANPDEVMNDDKYAYDSISFPALADVGELFTRHALQ